MVNPYSYKAIQICFKFIVSIGQWGEMHTLGLKDFIIEDEFAVSGGEEVPVSGVNFECMFKTHGSVSCGPRKRGARKWEWVY